MNRTYQIWGDFTPNGHITSLGCWRKGQLMGDGSLMEDFMRKFAEEGGEELRLIHEFTLVGTFSSDEEQHEASTIVYRAFQEGFHQ